MSHDHDEKDAKGDPRDAFEAQFPLASCCVRCGDGYAPTRFNAWEAQDFIERWKGWQAARADTARIVANAARYRMLRQYAKFFGDSTFNYDGDDGDTPFAKSTLEKAALLLDEHIDRNIRARSTQPDAGEKP